mmetsp:Transcript_1354/g.3734  ORF Transcript_1354/g.3734 Transcript_1354/m.3734 type:complete len:286 (-) Transcript_1354:460-1317(-)
MQGQLAVHVSDPDPLGKNLQQSPRRVCFVSRVQWDGRVLRRPSPRRRGVRSQKKPHDLAVGAITARVGQCRPSLGVHVPRQRGVQFQHPSNRLGGYARRFGLHERALEQRRVPPGCAIALAPGGEFPEDRGAFVLLIERVGGFLSRRAPKDGEEIVPRHWNPAEHGAQFAARDAGLGTFVVVATAAIIVHRSLISFLVLAVSIVIIFVFWGSKRGRVLRERNGWEGLPGKKLWLALTPDSNGRGGGPIWRLQRRGHGHRRCPRHRHRHRKGRGRHRRPPDPRSRG